MYDMILLATTVQGTNTKLVLIFSEKESDYFAEAWRRIHGKYLGVQENSCI
jgi:hypothetical protein